jgi:hypothetical protein
MEKIKTINNEFLKNLTEGCKGLKEVIVAFDEQNKKLQEQINKFQL